MKERNHKERAICAFFWSSSVQAERRFKACMARALAVASVPWRRKNPPRRYTPQARTLHRMSGMKQSYQHNRPQRLYSANFGSQIVPTSALRGAAVWHAQSTDLALLHSFIILVPDANGSLIHTTSNRLAVASSEYWVKEPLRHIRCHMLLCHCQLHGETAAVSCGGAPDMPATDSHGFSPGCFALPPTASPVRIE